MKSPCIHAFLLLPGAGAIALLALSKSKALAHMAFNVTNGIAVIPESSAEILRFVRNLIESIPKCWLSLEEHCCSWLSSPPWLSSFDTMETAGKCVATSTFFPHNEQHFKLAFSNVATTAWRCSGHIFTHSWVLTPCVHTQVWPYTGHVEKELIISSCCEVTSYLTWLLIVATETS